MLGHNCAACVDVYVQCGTKKPPDMSPVKTRLKENVSSLLSLLNKTTSNYLQICE